MKTKRARFTTLGTVPSATVKGRTYRIQSNGADKARCVAPDGSLCLGFKYSPVRWCSHLERWFSSTPMRTRRAA